MNAQIAPMTLGNIFEMTFSLIGKTIVRNVLAGVIFLIVPVVLVSLAADKFYSSIAEMGLNPGGQVGQEASFVPFFGGLVLFILSIFILVLCLLFAEITISYLVGKEIVGEPVPLREALRETFNVKWLYGIGQALLKYLIIGGGALVLGLFLSTFGVVIDNKIVVALLIGIAVIVAVPLVIFLVIRWYFSLTAVAVEALGPVDALRQSWYLVKDYWWRTLGILLLLSILSQFVIYIVSVPFTFGSMWNFYKAIFTSVGQTGAEPDAQAMSHALRTIGPGVGLGTGIGSLLSLLITPVFTVVMYFDLRARKGDLPATETPPQPGEEEVPPPDLIEPPSGGPIS
jgi:hypothetical protein